MTNFQSEFKEKLKIMRDLVAAHDVDGLLLRRISSFAWATCGAASYVNTAAAEGAASLLVTRDKTYLFTNNIEAVRLEEETELTDQGWEFQVSPWFDPMAALIKHTSGKKLIADVTFGDARDINPEFSRLRANLTAPECERMRLLGALCARIMDTAARLVRPGMSEYEIAGLLGGEAQKYAVQPIVNLVAVDERIFKYRHPLPTNKKLSKYAMLVLSGRKAGLVCSITRLVHFGPLPAETKSIVYAAAKVNAALISSTRPGNSLANILQRGQQVYTENGYADEWQQHHQGGVVGYEPREYLAIPGSKDLVSIGQAFAWNPSIAGAKMEDTLLVGEHSNEIITTISGWPVISIPVPELKVEIPCALVLEIN